MGRYLSRMLRWSVFTLIVLAMAANFTIIAQALSSPVKTVSGNSMQPYIEEDDAVLALPVRPEDLRTGDVVIFPDPESEECSIVHRVVSIREGQEGKFLETKGDANEVADPYLIPAEAVYGKVRLVLPQGGIVLRFLLTPYGYVLCVLCPFMILGVYLLFLKALEDGGLGKGILLRVLVA